jgi:hypothetical protein
LAWNGSTYQVSRALYRRLAPIVVEDGRPGSSPNRQRVLDACEHTMKRLAEEPDFSRPTRFLFHEIRSCFPMSAQLWLHRTIEIHIDFARPLVEQLRASEQRQCTALTRRGTPCRREKVPGSEFCPSHRHLECFYEAPGPGEVG